MLQARPLTGSTTQHVHRQRLLNLLPDSAGHVVWLHAPLGYGKSILAAQWAESLEIEGWRVLWTAADGSPLQSAVAAALRLPATAPWPLISAELTAERSLLVLEDLDDNCAELEQLLKLRHNTLLLLASRAPLPEPELARLRTQGLLLELGTSELAFTLSEAEQLTQRLNGSGAAAQWRETGGWPLPLHFALLTGSSSELPLPEALRRSLTAAAWQETLFLAGAGDLPHTADTEHTSELVAAGVLQQLSRHYRLHPLLAGQLRSRLPELVRTALAANAARLPPMQQLLAAERTGHDELLRAGLTQLPLATISDQPVEFLRLARSLPGNHDAPLKLREAFAALTHEPTEATLSRLRQLLAATELAPAERLTLLDLTAVMLSRHGRHDEALAFHEQAAELAGSQPLPERLNHHLNGTIVHGQAGRNAEAYAAARQVISQAAGSDDPRVRQLALLARMNSTIFRFQLSGEFLSEISLYKELLSEPELAGPRRPQLLLNLAMYHAYNLEDEQAIAAARECLEIGEPYFRLVAEYLIAYLEGDLAAFPDLLARARNWGVYSTTERVAALWLRAARKAADFSLAGRLAGHLPDGPFVFLERALYHQALGEQAEAERLLELARDGYSDREFRWHFQAASFLVSGADSELDALTALSPHPEQLVRYTLIPLERLPRSRPELSRAYPLAEVLASGWSGAVQLRLNEVPPLELRLLGGFQVRLLGQLLQLPARQQQLLALLALGYRREQIAVQLWPDSEQERITNNLSVQFHSLRRALEPWGVPTFLLDGSLVHTELDVAKLRAALAAGDAAAVLALYRAELLPETDLPALNEERESLREQVLSLLGSAAARAVPAEALPLLERLLQLDPLHEQALQLLLRTLLQLGRRNAARQRFEQFRLRLNRETGLEPPGELLRLLDE